MSDELVLVIPGTPAVERLPPIIVRGHSLGWADRQRAERMRNVAIPLREAGGRLDDVGKASGLAPSTVSCYLPWSLRHASTEELAYRRKATLMGFDPNAMAAGMHTAARIDAEQRRRRWERVLRRRLERRIARVDPHIRVFLDDSPELQDLILEQAGEDSDRAGRGFSLDQVLQQDKGERTLRDVFWRRRYAS